MNENIIFRDRPVQLVDIKDDGMFEITSDGISFLSSLKNEKIAVLSITGPYRSGKSFLANLIMDKMSGFKVGSTINACTKGLWVWGRPIKLENGRSLLIIDCEGLGSVEKDRTGNIDMKIFTLSVLLSSTIIYNTKHAISEDKIEELSNVANLTKRINISKDDKKNLGLEFSDFFPELIWVLRDFSLDRGEMSAKEYLESCLKTVDITNIDDGESKNICREIITKNFKQRDCYTLVMPSTDEARLRNLDNEPYSALRPEFTSQVEEMISKIKSTIRPKKVANVELDGEAMFGLLQAYVEDINNEENPVILSALENVLLSKAKNISEVIYEKFIDCINDKIGDRYPLTYNEIYEIFIDTQNNLVSDFCNEIKDTISSEQIGEYILKLFSRMKDELEVIIENNVAAFDDILSRETANITSQVKLKQYNKIEETKLFFLNLSNEIQNALNKFGDLSVNSENSKKIISSISSMLDKALFEPLRKVGASIEDINSSSLLKLNTQIDDMSIKIKQLTDALTNEKKITELKEKEISETKVKLYELESKNDSMKRKNKEKEKEYMNSINTELQKYQKMETSYMSLIQEKDDKIAMLQAQMNALSSKSTTKAQELSKENIKLQYELKKMKENSDKKNSIGDIYGDGNMKTATLQNLFKNFQENILTFKEDIAKLEQDKENIFKEKYIQKCKEEIESKTKNWGSEIISMIKKQIDQISMNYDQNVKRLNEEVDRLNKEIEKLQNENFMNNKYKINYEGAKNEVKELMYISSSKDDIIKTQLKDIAMKEEKINELTAQKENFEYKLSEFITNFRLKEEELEEVFLTLEAVFEKKKSKYEAHFNNLSDETQERFTQYAKKYKFKF